MLVSVFGTDIIELWWALQGIGALTVKMKSAHSLLGNTTVIECDMIE